MVYANYDGLNRQLWRNTSDTASGAYVSYSYDSTAGGNKGIGRLTGGSFSGGTTAHPLSGSYGFTYDARGQLTQQTLTTESSTQYTLGYGYNDAGMPTSLTYPDGEVLRNAYGTSGWLSAVTTTPSGGSAVNLLTNLTYGGPALQLTGASQGNGTYTYAASYDNDGRQTNSHLTRTSDSLTMFRSARTYDAVGNVTGVNTTLTTGTDNQAFCYDALDRLTWAGATGTPSCGGSLTAGTLTSAQYTQTFAYDTLTRLTSITSSGATGSSPGSYTYGDSAHLHAATATAGGYSATYDAAGDMVCRAPTSATTCTGGSPTGAQLAYDAERRLAHYQNIPGAAPDVEAWYLYDGAGNRVEQAVKQSGVTTSTYYLAGGAEEVRSDGSLIKYYGSLGLNTGATASTISYIASDGLGSLQVTLNGSGSATAQQLNAPYGSVRYSNGVFPTTKGFTGQRSDAAVSGLDYYGARYYDPALGQFTAADSVLDGFNPYIYVHGNPETLIDPSGDFGPKDIDRTIQGFCLLVALLGHMCTPFDDKGLEDWTWPETTHAVEEASVPEYNQPIDIPKALDGRDWEGGTNRRGTMDPDEEVEVVVPPDGTQSSGDSNRAQRRQNRKGSDSLASTREFNLQHLIFVNDGALNVSPVTLRLQHLIDINGRQSSGVSVDPLDLKAWAYQNLSWDELSPEQQND